MSRFSPREWTTSDARDWLLDFSAFRAATWTTISALCRAGNFDDACWHDPAGRVSRDKTRLAETAFGAHSLGGKYYQFTSPLNPRQEWASRFMASGPSGCLEIGLLQAAAASPSIFHSAVQSGKNDIVRDVPLVAICLRPPAPVDPILGSRRIDPLEAHHAAGYVAEASAAAGL